MIFFAAEKCMRTWRYLSSAYLCNSVSSQIVQLYIFESFCNWVTKIVLFLFYDLVTKCPISLFHIHYPFTLLNPLIYGWFIEVFFLVKDSLRFRIWVHTQKSKWDCGEKVWKHRETRKQKQEKTLINEVSFL